MKKVISFEKELDFPTMIGEIISISLDQNVDFVDSNSAVGKLIVSGTYKLTEASTLIEDFKYDIPVEVTLTEKLDLDTTKISISNFNYEIINDDILNCKIDLLVEGVEVIEMEEVVEEEKEEIELLEDVVDDDNNDDRECDGYKDDLDGEKEIPVKVDKKIEEFNEIEMPQSDIKNVSQEENKMKQEENETTNISSLFRVFENSDETFTTYSVYIMRKDDTLVDIMDKYRVSREQLSEYNDLDNLEVGTKIIIPSTNE